MKYGLFNMNTKTYTDTEDNVTSGGNTDIELVLL